jgi:hypothetical protein
MNRLQTTLIRMAALLFLAGCAVAPPAVEQPIVVAEPSPVPLIEQRVTPPRLTEDRDLFAEGLELLKQPERAERAKAHAVFASLLERYPQSRWRAAAETCIRLIDEIAASREEGRREQLLAEQVREELAGAMQEKEALEKKLRELTEKLQKETTSLVQENEKLKRDLQRLKELEIELEKRERMLR